MSAEYSRIRVYILGVSHLVEQFYSLLVALGVDVPADHGAAVRGELEAQLPADPMTCACHLYMYNPDETSSCRH